MVGVYLALFAVFPLLDLGLGTTLNRELTSLSARAGSAQAMRDLVRTLELIYWALAIVMGDKTKYVDRQISILSLGLLLVFPS